MKARFLALASLVAAVPIALFAGGGEERWVASSRTAQAITGDVLLSPTRLRAAGVDFPLKVAADLPDFVGDFGAPVPARLLAVTRPMNPKLLRGNTLGCGHPIRWIAVWRLDGGGGLALDVFESARMPRTVKDPGFCGSYFYVRP